MGGNNLQRVEAREPRGKAKLHETLSIDFPLIAQRNNSCWIGGIDPAFFGRMQRIACQRGKQLDPITGN